MTKPLRILVLSTTFPAGPDPLRGVFVKERARALAGVAGIEVRVVAPVPWFPPIQRFSKWYRLSQYARYEVLDGLHVDRPRYPLPPRIGGYMHPQLMYPAIRNWVDRLRERYSFDLIDAHFVYPSGVVATRLARRYAVPVVLTGRGEDMLRFPQKPLMGERIRWALRHANRCIGVSQEIASAMIDNGAEPSTTSIVANGVDVTAFHPLAKAACRNRLGLPLNKQILLTVGDRLELKGFHLLVEAMPSILKHHPEALLVIVGGPGRFGRDYTDEIQSRIQSLGLNRRVVLAGPKPHGELASWYNAADLFVLMSSREGSPNVLIEALSCGTPSIGTAVGGIPDELSESSKGLLLPERTAAAASHVIVRALATEFDRKAIADAMRVRSWEATAQRLAGMLRETCDNHHIKPSR